ncbi:hypothetical protein IIA15_10560 [candidate division TA06 bacterium]|nr:hypothetical protein [candidate division TA06 bacterium]
MKTVQTIIDQNGGLEALKENGLKVKVPSYPSIMELVIEYIGEGPRGLPAVSVAHYYTQNGDLMRDPEMVFEVGDPTFGDFQWGPTYFRQDGGLAIEQEAVFTDPETKKVMVRPKLIKSLRSFARTWSKNLKAQGFLDADATVEKIGSVF